jgi:hypothetical protein
MMTISELNKHADTLDTNGMVGENSFIAPDGARADPGEIIGKVCGVYQKVRPFLEVITNLFFIPKKWRSAVMSFIVVMDGLCPGE